eukprot:TCONS_00058085-protein
MDSFITLLCGLVLVLYIPIVVDAQEDFNILNPPTCEHLGDFCEGRGKLTPFEIDVEAKTGTVVGTVQASLNNQNAQYSIIDVRLLDEKDTYSKPRWYNTAIHVSRDDCSENTLESYTSYRKMFCIDHIRGTIFTTKYFNLPNKQKLNFYMHFRAQQILKTEYPEVAPIPIKVTSVCDLMYSLRSELQKCNNDTVMITNDKDANNPKDSLVYRFETFKTDHYLTQLNIDFNQLPRKSPPEIEDGHPLKLWVKINGQEPEEIDMLYREKKTEAAYLSYPVKVDSQTTIEVKLHTVYIESGDFKSSRSLREKVVTLVLLESRDYCTNNTYCVLLAQKYMNDARQLQARCVNIDELSFGPKYGFCPGNSTVPKKQKFVFQYDSVKDSRTPTLVATDYLPFHNGGNDYVIKIKDIVSNMHYNKYKVLTSTGHEDCTEHYSTGYLPRLFFCINESNGKIYNTKLIDRISPDERFEITLNITRKKEAFPHFQFTTLMKLSLRISSLCTRPYSLYRTLSMQCQVPCAYIAHLVPTQKDHSLMHSYNVTVQISRATYPSNLNCPRNGVSGQKYFISHLIRTSKAPTPNPSELGDFVRFWLKTDYQKTQASYFLRLEQAGFTNRIIYTEGMHFVFSATRYYHKTQKEVEYNFDWAKWGVFLIPFKDYCLTGEPKCKNAFKEYDLYTQTLSYSKSPETNFKVMCGDPDMHGLRTLYGNCGSYPRPSILKTEYLLERSGGAYSQVEVIPGQAAMYATLSYPMKYELLSVTAANNKTFDTVDGRDIKSPEGCTQSSLPITAPLSFFCINENTGRIYTTSAIADQLNSDVEFRFEVRISNTTIYPIRDQTVDLVLTSIDPCKTTRPDYEELNKCVNYSSKPLTNSTGNSYHFEMPTNYQRIVALKVPLSNLRMQSNVANKLNVSTFIQGYNSDGNVTFKYNSPYQIYYTEDVSLVINAPVSFVGGGVKSLKITLIEGGSETEIEIIKPTNQSDVSLLYINNFACTADCKARFESWKSKVAELPSNCQFDRMFYNRNFDVCTAERPTFPDELYFNTDELIVDAQVLIKNCSYISPYTYSTSFWIKDDKKIDSTIVMSRKRRSMDPDALPNLPRYNVDDLVIRKLSLADQGTYKCGVRDGDEKQREYLSNSIFLGLKDIAKTDVKITLVDTENQVQPNTLADKLKDIINGDRESPNLNLQVEFRDVTRGGFATFEFRIIYAGTRAVRERFCTEINSSNLRNGLSTEYNVLSFDITHQSCCIAVTEGDVNFRGVYSFPFTLTGHSVSFKCQYGRMDGTEELVFRSCRSNTVGTSAWEKFDISACRPKTVTSEKLIELQTVENTEDALIVSRNLSAIVNEGNLTSRFDVEIVTDILKVVVAQNASSTEVAENVIATVDGVLDTDEEILIESNEQMSTSSNILSQLDTLALNQPATENATVIQRRNIGFGILRPDSTTPILIKSLTDSNSNSTQFSITQTNETPDETVDASIILPAEVVGKATNRPIYSYLFKKPSFFLSKNGNLFIQSMVLSASVGDVTIRNLTDPVKLGFQTKKPNVTGLVNTCKFYDMEKQDWSTEGCRTIRKFGSDEVKCECDHLTNFAILLDVSQTGANPLALQIITWIGCGISLAGLFLTIVTYMAFAKLRRKLPPKILINLSVSLSAVLIIFLVGAEKTEPRIGCQVVAGLLHYFILTTFCWMAIEALNLYRNFVKVFSGGASNFRFMVKCSIFSWGLPAVVVIITAVSKPDHLGPADETHAQFCVVRGIPFFAAVLLPVVLVLLGNMIVLVLVLRAIKDGSQLVKDSKAAKNKKMTQARIAFACSVLLGLTWVFAILAIGELRDFFQWLFCIFNSLQGFFIFIFYTLRSTEVRREWKRFFGFGSMERTSTGSSSKYNSKYISIYRLTHVSSLVSRKKSQSSSINNNDDDKQSIKNKNAK